MSLVEGFTTDRFASLRDHLEKSLLDGNDVGASVTVFHHEELVCDLWGGYRDEARTLPWERDTIVNVWSLTKTMTFIVALMLSDRGELDFDERVAHYWPEFAAEGKDEVTVSDLMNHTAGLPGWSEPITSDDLANWELCCSLLAAQAPWWRDRTHSGYHAITQGFLIGEVVRRITGTSIGDFFRREVAEVLGADFFIGLPASEEARVATVIPEINVDRLPYSHDSIAYRTLTSPLVKATAPRERWWRAAEIPAANGQGNARSVATIQQIMTNGGHALGHRFFSEETASSVFVPRVQGVDEVLRFDVAFGLGYGLASKEVPIGPRSCYWGGFGGSLVIMDQDLGLTVCYAMNLMRVGLSGDDRGPAIALLAATSALA